MGWVRIDDAFYDHQKFIEAGPAGIALWVTALAWSNRNLTDGFIPAKQIPRLVDYSGIAREIGGASGLYAVDEDVTGYAVAVELCELGIFDDVPGGYQIHDYLDFQPSAEQITKKREKERERWKRRNSEEDSETPPNPLRGNSAATPPASQPQPPLLSNDKRGPADKRRRGTRIPEDFDLTAEREVWAHERCPGLDVVLHHERFVNYWRSATRNATKLDWDATWRNWMLGEFDKMPNRRPFAETKPEPRREPPPSRVDTCPSCDSSLLACRCEARQSA